MTVLTTFDQNEFTAIIAQSVAAAVQSELSKITTDSTTQKQFLSRHETSELLGISLVTLDSYVKSGFIDAYRLGHKVRFKYADVLQALTKINVGG